MTEFPVLLRGSNALIVVDGVRVQRGCDFDTGATSMRLLRYLAVAMLATVLLPAHHASAFTSDPASGTNVDGSPRFVDPDDQIRSIFSGGAGQTQDSASDRNLGPRNAFPTPGGSNQGTIFPNWFFPTRR
jgi:hypothetical protein